jgi:hypothetical protein
MSAPMSNTHNIVVTASTANFDNLTYEEGGGVSTIIIIIRRNADIALRDTAFSTDRCHDGNEDQPPCHVLFVVLSGTGKY